MTSVLLATGSNLGNRLANLRAVAAALAPEVRVLRASPVYETAPWGYADQQVFLNQVLEAETQCTPLELLALLKEAEVRLGRQPSFLNGPRLIDIDLLAYAEEVIDLPDLQVPHPRMRGRAFVLRPLADLAPGWRHPLYGMTARQLADETDPALAWTYRWPSFGRKTAVMGILNLTPDSFSGDGLLASADPLETALAQARDFIAAGADILDIGGESTRPGSQPVPAEVELERVLPIVHRLVNETSAVLSIDTSKAAVAEACLQAGADWINDVWGLRADPRLAEVIATAGAPVILMHNRSNPASAEVRERLGGRYVGMQYADLLGEVKAELLHSVSIARGAGILGRSILLDPGIGFGKTVEQNLELIDRLNELRALGYPLLLGPSRKSFIGYTLDLPPADRLEGTAAAVAVGIARGADIIRVHDVREMARVARMTDAIVRRNTTGEKDA